MHLRLVSVTAIILLKIASCDEVPVARHKFRIVRTREDSIGEPAIGANIGEKIARTTSSFCQQFNGVCAGIVAVVKRIVGSGYASRYVMSHQHSLLTVDHKYEIPAVFHLRQVLFVICPAES